MAGLFRGRPVCSGLLGISGMGGGDADKDKSCSHLMLSGRGSSTQARREKAPDIGVQLLGLMRRLGGESEPACL